LAVNKWDLTEKSDATVRSMTKQVTDRLRRHSYLPVIFISAKTKKGIFKLIDLVLQVHAERSRELRTTELNKFLQEATKNYPPPSMDRKEVKLKYCTQVKSSPPVFAIFCNHPGSVKTNYRHYLENRFRERFGFQGVPLTFSFRKK